MIRRIILSSVAALGLALLPLSAMGYDAPPYTTTVSDSSPGVGQPFTVTSTGIMCGVHGMLTGCGLATLTVRSAPLSISDAAITIAGTKSLTKTARFDHAGGSAYRGTVVWTVTLAEAGTYTLTVVQSQTRTFMSELTIVVGASDDGGQPGDGWQLSGTGLDVLALSGVAGGLVVVGVVGVWLARRRGDRAFREVR